MKSWFVLCCTSHFKTGLANETLQSFVRLFSTLILRLNCIQTMGSGLYFWSLYFLLQIIRWSSTLMTVYFVQSILASATPVLRKSILLNTWYVFESAAAQSRGDLHYMHVGHIIPFRETCLLCFLGKKWIIKVLPQVFISSLKIIDLW